MWGFLCWAFLTCFVFSTNKYVKRKGIYILFILQQLNKNDRKRQRKSTSKKVDDKGIRRQRNPKTLSSDLTIQVTYCCELIEIDNISTVSLKHIKFICMRLKNWGEKASFSDFCYIHICPVQKLFILMVKCYILHVHVYALEHEKVSRIRMRSLWPWSLSTISNICFFYNFCFLKVPKTFCFVCRYICPLNMVECNL